MGFDKRKVSQAQKKKFEDMERAKAAGELPSKRARTGVVLRTAELQADKGPSATSSSPRAIVPVAQVAGQTSGSGPVMAAPPARAPAAQTPPVQAETSKEPFIVEDVQAAWQRMQQFISMDDLIPFDEFTNAQLTRSMNLDAVKLHCKALCLSTRLKAKANEVVKKGQVIETLTTSHSELEKKVKDAGEALATLEAEKSAVLDEVEGLKKRNEELTSESQSFEAIKASFASRVAELEAEVRSAAERAVAEFKLGVAFNDEVQEAYMEGFIDAKVAAKKLFPDLDFTPLKPADDTTSQAPADEEQNRAADEEDDAQS